MDTPPFPCPEPPRHLPAARLFTVGSALAALVVLPACGHAPPAGPVTPARPAAPPAAPPPAARRQEQPDVQLRTPASFALSPDEAAGMAGPGPEPPAPGSVDKEVIRRVIKSHAFDLKRACYDP